MSFPDPHVEPFVPERTWRTNAAEILGWYRAVGSWARPRRPPLPPAPRPRRVVVLPGFGMTDRTTVVLRRYLRACGHEVVGWGLGTNHGHLEADVERVAERLDHFGRRVVLVGWSLGGVLAREVARDHGHRVERVVTLGSPVIDGPRFTSAGPMFAAVNGTDLDSYVARIRARLENPLPVPVTVVFSRNDRIVAWPATRDPWTRDVEYVEVSTTHTGLGFHPEPLAAIARTLARQEAAGSASSSGVGSGTPS